MLTQEKIDYVTVEEASARAHVSAATLRRAIHDGALRYRAQQGVKKFLDAAEVDAWARARNELRPLNGGK